MRFRPMLGYWNYVCHTCMSAPKHIWLLVLDGKICVSEYGLRGIADPNERQVADSHWQPLRFADRGSGQKRVLKLTKGCLLWVFIWSTFDDAWCNGRAAFACHVKLCWDSITFHALHGRHFLTDAHNMWKFAYGGFVTQSHNRISP